MNWLAEPVYNLCAHDPIGPESFGLPVEDTRYPQAIFLMTDLSGRRVYAVVYMCSKCGVLYWKPPFLNTKEIVVGEG